MTEKCKLPELGETLAEFNDLKRRSEFIAGLFYNDEFFHKRAKNMRNCGTMIGMEPSSTGEGLQVATANFCRQRMCPMCQRRRALRTFAAMNQLADLAMAEGYSFLHLVLTVPNCTGGSLSKTIDRLYRCSSLLFRQQQDRHVLAALGRDEKLLRIRAKMAKAFAGVFRALEVTHKEGSGVDDPNAFHPHLHCLVAVRKSYFKSRAYVKYEDIRAVWGRLVGVESPQLYISKVTEKSAAIAEVAKYCVKPFNGDMAVDVLFLLHRALFGRRLTQTYGQVRKWLRALKIDLEADETFDPAAKPVVWLRYNGEIYQPEMV